MDRPERVQPNKEKALLKRQKKGRSPQTSPSSTHPLPGTDGLLCIVRNLFVGTGTNQGSASAPHTAGTFFHPLRTNSFHIPSAFPFAGIDGFLEVRGNHQASHDPYPRRPRDLATNSSHSAGTDKSIRLSGSATNPLP